MKRGELEKFFKPAPKRLLSCTEVIHNHEDKTENIVTELPTNSSTSELQLITNDVSTHIFDIGTVSIELYQKKNVLLNNEFKNNVVLICMLYYYCIICSQ